MHQEDTRKILQTFNKNTAYRYALLTKYEFKYL